jgi:hypothetical protein
LLPAGLQLKLPFLDVYTPIQITLQTDKVTNIPCGTKGVMVYFEKVEVSSSVVHMSNAHVIFFTMTLTCPPMQVVNRLRKDFVLDTIREYGEKYDDLWIFSKIHHEMNQLCSHSTLQEIYIDKFDQVQTPGISSLHLLT